MELQDIIYYGKDATQKLTTGVERVAKAVACTMGPSGRSVVLGSSNGMPVVTKDGVSIANYITLVDPTENMGAELIKQAAANTVKDTGDGTSTCCVLTNELVKNFNLYNYNLDFRRGVLDAKDLVIKTLQNYKLECDDYSQINKIALTSSNGDVDLANLISESVQKSGTSGGVQVEFSNQKDISVEHYKGYKMNSGWLNTIYMNNPEKIRGEFGKSNVLIIKGKLENTKDTLNLLKLSRNGGKGLVIIADDFSEKLQNLSIQNVRSGWNLILIRSEGFADYKSSILEDLAAYLDCKVHMPSDLVTKGAHLLPKVSMGELDNIEIYQDYSMITRSDDCNDETLNKRIKVINVLIESCRNDTDLDKLKVRLNQLSGGYSKLLIGGFTESEAKERFDRAEDAVGAAQAAVKGGIIPGGGNPLFKIGNSLVKMAYEESQSDYYNGFNSVMESITAPFVQIISNTGFDIKNYKDNVLDSNELSGLDATDLKVKNLIEIGVVDPLAVTKSALNNSISAALLVASVGATLQNTFQEIN